MALSRAELLSMFHKTAAEIAEKEFKSITEATVISELVNIAAKGCVLQRRRWCSAA